MAAINFPDPSASPWTNPDTGITYTYSNGVWSVASASSAGVVKLDDGGTKQVIQSAGLGLSNGTDEKITLNSTGSADFAGAVSVGPSSTSTTFVNVNPNGVVAQNPNANTSNVFFKGRTSAGDDKVSLFTDGSATFKGDVTTGSYGTNTSGSRLFGTYGLVLDAPNTATSDVFQVRSTDGTNTTITASVGVDGTAQFAKEVISGNYYNGGNGCWMYPQGLLGLRNDADGAQVFQVLSGGSTNTSETIGMWADGSASFAGDVTAGSDGIRFTKLRPSGYIHSRGGDIDGFIRCEDTSANAKFTVSGVGDVVSGNAYNVGNGSALYSSGLIGVRNDTPASTVFQVLSGGFSGNNETLKLTAGGTATFALQTLVGTASQGTYTNASGNSRIAVNTSGVGTVFNVDDNGKVLAKSFDLESLTALPA